MWNLVTTLVEVEGEKPVESYGIKCGSTVIHDISLSKEKIAAFVEKLNRLGASEVHAYDLAEEFLGNIDPDFQ